jgi:hypothetical protein
MANKVELSPISTILNRLFKTSIREDSVSEGQDNDYGDTCRRIMQYDGLQVKVKRHLEDLLRKDQLAGFILVNYIKEHEIIAIPWENDLEQFGIFTFSLRGMLITSQDERTIHQGNAILLISYTSFLNSFIFPSSIINSALKCI